MCYVNCFKLKLKVNCCLTSSHLIALQFAGACTAAIRVHIYELSKYSEKFYKFYNFEFYSVQGSSMDSVLVLQYETMKKSSYLKV